MKRILLLIIIIFSFNLSSHSQTDFRAEKQKKNIIRYNISSPTLFGFKAVIFGYERAISPSKSFSINIGVPSLPNFSSSVLNSSLDISKASTNHNFHASADFR